ncbi:uncharacterized protein LOC111060230 [Nilaparvata lugens]|uniref:uncharacterized protein LOC111060230 n=1 Tax=Nilaparvata lugens TaxID=108931 RepID=UPI00193EA2EF|nr:uncharacterized protein LOC111060230 [Nilaparvata lugens]XP_039295615.1 uncharacterized protein LOC111060230 [Nilaparvata lugens]
MSTLIRAVATFLFLFWIGTGEKVESLKWNIDKMNNNLIYQISHNDTVSDQHNQEDLDPKEIVSKMLEKLKKILKNGDKEHDLPSVDPQWFSIKRKVEEENLQLTMIFDGQVSNTSNLQWTNLFTCPLTMQIQMEVLVEDVFINGTYNLTGLAYDAFPIFGDGDFQINIDDIRLVITAELSPKQGDNPLEMDNLNVHFMDLQGLRMNFENLMGDADMALLLSQLAADFSEKVAYDVVSEMEKTPNEVIYSIVSDRISQLTLLDIVSSINNF